jgi:polyphosphate kinase 2 (PPK2 family)
MRLADAILDACLCDPQAPLAQDPARDFGLSKEAAQQAMAGLKPWLNEQQRMLWANRQHALLLLLQGPDCSGKDGVIRKVVNAFDPQGISLHGFHQPDEQERRQHFLQRYRQRLPQQGLLGVFNRSHYEALICDPLDGLCSEADVPQRLQELLGFEREWPAQQLHPLKCYLQISREEQKRRLLSRLERPEKRWKLHNSDLQAYREYALRQQRWSDLLAASHTPEAPWYVLPSDHRWLRDWLVASLLARELERLQLAWPDSPPPFSASDLDAAD